MILIQKALIPKKSYGETFADISELIFSILLKATPYKDIDLDYNEYLTVELLFENGEWKIQSYALEL